jgi:triosephosphate isomerase
LIILRTKIIAGNWKMNKLPSEAAEFVTALKSTVADAKADVVVCPTFVCLRAVINAAKGSNIKVGAQNVHWEESGAFTGEVAPLMLKELGVEYVIIGHSERRQYFGETNETVNKRTHAAFNAGLKPIVCVGETLTQREQGITIDLLRMQTRIAIQGLTPEQVKTLVIAYEPVWAIGTGKTASSADANDACAAIRQLVKELYGEEVSSQVRIHPAGASSETFAIHSWLYRNRPQYSSGCSGR